MLLAAANLKVKACWEKILYTCNKVGLDRFLCQIGSFVEAAEIVRKMEVSEQVKIAPIKLRKNSECFFKLQSL